ncbi:MAG: hypothetical protein IPG02_11865 [Ignavibacteria bacterium]|nr:hypothetical protein [Ignavibacteria bacterium]
MKIFFGTINYLRIRSQKIKPYSLALHNALFTVTPPNSLVLIAECDEKLKTLTHGKMYLGFGLFSYLPTLPDPYAANLGLLSKQFSLRGQNEAGVNIQGHKKSSNVWMWLFGLVQWDKKTPAPDDVSVSFYFAPLQAPLNVEKDEKIEANIRPANEQPVIRNDLYNNLSSYQTNGGENPQLFPPTSNITGGESLLVSRNALAGFSASDFALLDVSSNANQMGIAFTKVNNDIQRVLSRKYKVSITDEQNASVFPIQIRGLDVITAGMNVQAFTVPSIAWEPVFNLTKPYLVKGGVDDNGVTLTPPYDPPIGFNYYDSDGFATRIGNLSKLSVPMSPIPMSKFLVKTYQSKEDGKTYAFFNLPFGMVAFTILDNRNSSQSRKPTLANIKPDFEGKVKGGIQLELTAGVSLALDESDLFEGFSIQLMNINHADGKPSEASTLAATPTKIFEGEFKTPPSSLPGRPGVPLTRVGLSGYGASMFSNWENRTALFAQVSQAQFNVITGRTSHEVVQVKSMLYPWGIRVVRTITILRLASGYVTRFDSGWKAESNGKYDFSYYEPIYDAPPNQKKVIGKKFIEDPFKFHPGIVNGLYNIRNIKEQPKIFGPGSPNAELYAVTFDADVELENVTEGGSGNRVSAKGILAYVQVSPPGEPITLSEFVELLDSEDNSIGGPIDCIIKVAGTKQHMKVNRFDVSRTVDDLGETIFVCAARGSVILPKDGSWSIVKHNRKTGDVSPLPEQLSAPLVRSGVWSNGKLKDPTSVSNLVRVAHPVDLLKPPDDSTINFGFLQNMGTQKVLFMTPAFKRGSETLVSKAPPLLADSFRLLNSSSIFPNIGNLDNNFGEAVSLLKGVKGSNPVDAFKKINVAGFGDVYELLHLDSKEPAGKLIDQGYKLAKGALGDMTNELIRFDLPSMDYPLINFKDFLIIRMKYEAKEGKASGKNYVGKLDFDIDSFAQDMGNTWKGRMNNLSIVVTIGPLTDVMKIKGNFNSQKGKEVDLGSKNSGDSGDTLPLPEIEFSDAVEPVIKILEILASLSSGDYGDALKKGLKVAMSNSANMWEYKFEATKDISLVRFPPLKEAYESPLTPLKLEASMSIGVFFNAALKVTTDPKQLLPTAGAFFKFHGGMQVMCVSVGVGTIYAVGNVDLKLEADSSPKLAVTLKFGFGAQITVGLPVVGHASVLFMVGVEIYADSTSKVRITGFMLFRGEAELLGGLVCVTITIEAKGSIERESGDDKPAICKAQVTFAIDISIFLIIDISFSESWEEERQIA